MRYCMVACVMRRFHSNAQMRAGDSLDDFGSYYVVSIDLIFPFDAFGQ